MIQMYMYVYQFVRHKDIKCHSDKQYRIYFIQGTSWTFVVYTMTDKPTPLHHGTQLL